MPFASAFWVGVTFFSFVVPHRILNTGSNLFRNTAERLLSMVNPAIIEKL